MGGNSSSNLRLFSNSKCSLRIDTVDGDKAIIRRDF